MDLSGHAALVTGGARGIGRAIALTLAGRGADVAVLDLNAEAGQATRAEVEALGRKSAFIACDVSDPAAIETACKAALEALPGLDILVNNAGITRDSLLWRLSPADWDLVLRINLSGAFHFTRLLTRPMARKGFGRIVNIASVIGEMGNVGQANYAAAKAGLIGLTKSVAKEFAAKGITANAVAPGFIETDMTAGLEEKVREAMQAAIPARRMGVAQDVANVVAFLASPESGYVTGQVLRVDGGMLMG
ncbi:MAG: 3-oxoacyl-[acyl-carrier-protein] reductase [Candidatus Eisenbacteria bacterium]|nr:3-oxoacyl-[acyl-carrier-protein] reductase [Candidatus Eisenbacteria bacterium]